MKNKEFYKDKIYEAACKYRRIAVNKETGEPCGCISNCNGCAFNVKKYYPETCTSKWKKWLEEEHVEPILDEVEKRYLESVIRPFRNRVKYIRKSEFGKEFTFINICVYCYIDTEVDDDILLPYFDETKMYTGMEKNKFYTLEELGLFE